MSKTIITLRLDNSVLQDMDSRCVSECCCRTDFIKNAINDALKSKESVPTAKINRISYDDGKTWIDLE